MARVGHESFCDQQVGHHEPGAQLCHACPCLLEVRRHRRVPQHPVGVESSEDKRRDYRELLFRSTEAMKNCISGVILYDETIRQQKEDGTPFAKAVTDAGIIPGIKVDSGAKDLAGHPGKK